MTLSWTDQVLIKEDVLCEISTYKAFDGALFCDIDIPNKIITFEGIFDG